MKREWFPVSAPQSGGISRKSVSAGMLKDSAGTGSIRVRYELKGLWKNVVEYDGHEYIRLGSDETGNMQETGAPSVPQEGLWIALPADARFKELKVVDCRLKEMEITCPMLPAPKPVKERAETEYVPDPRYYGSDEEFPGKAIEYLSTEEVAGMRTVHVMVYLAQYVPLRNRLSCLEYMDFEVVYETSGKDSVPAPFLRRVNKPLASAFVLGYDLQADSYGRETDVACGEPSDASLKSPTNKGEFLVITTDALKDAFDDLLRARSGEFRTRLVTKEEILAEFSAATEEESIRQFLIYAVPNWSVPPQYVILGGNVDRIPTYIRNYDGENMASDHYFADLNDDMIPEICVSRFPASAVDDMRKLCDAAVAYYSQNGTWGRNVLLNTYQRADYERCKDGIHSSINTRFTPIKKYGSDPAATKAEVARRINAGVGFINYRGHGDVDEWSSVNGLSNRDIPSLSNAGMLPHVLSIACLTNKINHNPPAYDCFGITWMIRQKAASFLGASIESYTTVNDDFDRYLWDAVINNGKERICDIFNYATTNLYRNNRTSTPVKANIYMYLLLGDPTLSYNRKFRSTSFVLMLDRSGTMDKAIEQVKIDTKAFIREARVGDQFGINTFETKAAWLYPKGSNPGIVTISDINKEPKEAEAEIDTIHTGDLTNMGDAIRMGQRMLDYDTPNTKALVLLSDGAANHGPDPNQVLGGDIPLFVAGLGPWLRREYFEKMLALNPQSKYYHEAKATDMALVFNDIRALAPRTRLAANSHSVYAGTDFQIVKAQVTKDSGKAQFAVVWSDKRFTYTSKYPDGFNIGVSLVQPNGKRLAREPEIAGAGYCIFNVDDARPGEWGILVEYAVGKTELPEVKGTVGVFQFDTDISVDFALPNVLNAGTPLDLTLKVMCGNNPIENLKVDMEMRYPEISVDNALVKYAGELKSVNLDNGPFGGLAFKDGKEEQIFRLKALRERFLEERRKDILDVKTARRQLDFRKDNGGYGCLLKDTLEAGSYSFRVHVSGVDPVSGQPVSLMASRSVLVG